MECPSCGFQNMPGRTECASCSAALSAGSQLRSVVPPRAKDRSFGQRIQWSLASTPGVVRAGQWIDGLRLRLGMGLGAWAWVTPQALCLIIQSVVPGFGHTFMLRRRAAGVGMFAIGLVSLVLAAVLYRTYIADFLAAGVTLLSMVSVVATVDTLRGGSRDPERRLYSLLGITLLVAGMYAGCYAALSVTLFRTVTVVAHVPRTTIRRGDALLIWSHGSIGAGDIAVGVTHFNNTAAPAIGRLIAEPGDTVAIGDRLYVNGNPRPAWLPPLGQQYGAPRRYSMAEYAERRLKADEFWIVPNLNLVPSPQALLQAGTIRRSEIWGRVVAIVGPPARRAVVSRASGKER